MRIVEQLSIVVAGLGLLSLASCAHPRSSSAAQAVVEDGDSALPSFIPEDRETAPLAPPRGICIFDIDNTLMAKHFTNPGRRVGDSYLAPHAAAAMVDCIDHGFGVAFDSYARTSPGGAAQCAPGTTVGDGCDPNQGRTDLLLALFRDNDQFTDRAERIAVGQALLDGVGLAVTPSEPARAKEQYHAVFRIKANGSHGSGKVAAFRNIYRAYYGEEILTPRSGERSTRCVAYFDDSEGAIGSGDEGGGIRGFVHDNQVVLGDAKVEVTAVQLVKEDGLTQPLFDNGNEQRWPGFQAMLEACAP
ncbi:MAG: hypothetical protein AAF799_04485 [Myxococcota bacterium]